MTEQFHHGQEAIGHPRPMLRRSTWWSLDGEWEFALDTAMRWTRPEQVVFDRTILVPFAPETPASGVHHTGYVQRCWYRRTVRAPETDHRGTRLVLHFGAVDHAATVWIDGCLVVQHEGGYSPFRVDITPFVADGLDHELVVRADDDAHDLAKPRGKQDWEEEPHAIWYHRTTGIWQTVWLEWLPDHSIRSLQWATSDDGSEVSMEVEVAGNVGPDLPAELYLRVSLTVGDRFLVDDTIRVMGRVFSRAFRLDATGLDELREHLVWTPDHPTLIDAQLSLIDCEGTVVDTVHSYTAIRTIELRQGRFVLNSRPWQLRLVLDQGYWPDTGLTPPDDDALRRDVELAKAMGFNGVRKHQKIEDPRYLYWADRLGLFVWYECPPAYRFDNIALRRLTFEWLAAVERDRSHPCIITWVPFNESTGITRVADRQDQRDFVRGIVHLTRALDATRPVMSNDGWENLSGDLIGIHDYEQDPARLLEHWNGDLQTLLLDYGSHGRLQTLDEDDEGLHAVRRPVRPLMLTEFGGIGWDPGAPVDRSHDNPTSNEVDDRLTQPSSWGYSTVASPGELAQRYIALLDAVHRIPRLAGFCYTQFADTYQEVNGLLTADRRPKVPIGTIARATRGVGRSFYDPLSSAASLLAGEKPLSIRAAEADPPATPAP